MTTKTDLPPGGTFMELNLAEIKLGENIRTGDIDIAQDSAGIDLIQSIKAHGVLQPVIVIKGEDGKFTLRSGYRRYSALKKAAQDLKRSWENTKIPAMVYTVSEAEGVEMAIIENIQRQDMKAGDRAKAMKMLIEKLGVSQKDLAIRLGVTDGYVSQHLSYLDAPSSVQKFVNSGKMAYSGARHFSPLKDKPELVGKVMEELSQIEGPYVTSEQAKEAVQTVLREEKAKEEAAAARAAEKDKADGKKPKKSSKDEDEKVVTIVDKLRDAKIKTPSENTLRKHLLVWGEKIDRSTSPERRKEYELVFQGLAIAAGLEKL